MRVYVAGPYTLGNVESNIHAAITAGERLLKAGHTPYVPHLNHLWGLLYPGSREQWMRLDLNWLLQCEAVLRLPGISQGADVEVATAHSLGLPVFWNITDLAPEAHDDYDL